MPRKTYHKFEIIEQRPIELGTIIGIDPIELDGPFGLSDEIYALLCRLSRCLVCGDPTEAIERHRLCLRKPETWTYTMRGVEFTEPQGQLGFVIPEDAYTEQFRPAFDRGWQHRQRSTRAYRMARNSGSHTNAQICGLLECQQQRCYYCYAPFNENGEGGYHFHRDHVVAVVEGGSDDIFNIVLACAACNMDKGGEDWDSFRGRRVHRVANVDREALQSMQQAVDVWKREQRGSVEGSATASAAAAPSVPTHVGSERIASQPGSVLKLTPDAVPFRLGGDSLQRWMDPLQWKHLAAAATRASGYICAVCGHQPRSYSTGTMQAYEHWTYAHEARPASARLERLDCLCFSCYVLRRITPIREMVGIGSASQSMLDDAIAQFCYVNACDASVLIEIERENMQQRRQNMQVFYELDWGIFERLLGPRIRQEHEFTLLDAKHRRTRTHQGPGPLVGDIAMPIPDGTVLVHVVPLFDTAHSSGLRKTTKVTGLLAINGSLGSDAEQVALAWCGRPYGEFRAAAVTELEKYQTCD